MSNDTEVIKCYKVSNIECGARVVWDSLKGATDDIMVTLESMDEKERAEIDEIGLDSIARKITENTLSVLGVGEKTDLFNGFFTVEAVEMTRQEVEALPEHDGC